MRNISFLLLITLSLSLNANSQAPKYQVYALRFASVAHLLPVSSMSDTDNNKDSVGLDFMIWLIRGNNGKNILVDAGFKKDIEEGKGFDFVNYMRPDSTLLQLSVKPTDITDIILTHPHWDHADGLDLFPNAQIWFQKEDFNNCIGTAWQKGGQPGGFNKRDMRFLIELNLAGRLTLVDGDDKEIIPGIKVFTGSRHTFNSQYVLVETGTNKVILASDNIWIYYSLDHMLPASKGGTLDPAGYVKAMQRMKTLASNPKFIIPGHDSKVFTLFPKISERIVEIK